MPVGHFVRAYRDRWVRFHSLPDSKRYADGKEELSEVLHRHHTVLRELAGEDGGPMLVVTCSYSLRPRPSLRMRWRAVIRARRTYWCSVVEDDSLPHETLWAHLFIERRTLGDRRLRRLLRLVAHDIENGVIVADPDWRWLYHPYDGGADVVTPTRLERDALRDRHVEWLPTHPQGL